MTRDEALRKVQMYDFALTDTGLFLDTHPNCKEAIEYYNKAQAVREEAWNEYTGKFGPLSFYEVSDENYWEWNQGPMPWEGGDC